jgi:taurine dioxygenase
VDVRALEPFGVAVRGLDLTDPTASGDTVRELLRDHALVVIEGCEITAAQQIDLVGAVGVVLDEGMQGAFHSHIRHDPDVRPVLAAEGVFVGPLSFHSDLTYTSHPHHVLSLYALELPTTGGETRFANGARALAALPSEQRARVEHLTARHVFNASVDEYGGRYHEAALGPRYFVAEHPMVRRNDRTGRDVLFVNELLTDRIPELGEEESESFLRSLFAVLYADDNVYVHHWQPHDLVIWENREVQHARADFDRSQRRVLRRVIVGDADLNARHNVEFQAQLAGAPGSGAIAV